MLVHVECVGLLGEVVIPHEPFQALILVGHFATVSIGVDRVGDPLCSLRRFALLLRVKSVFAEIDLGLFLLRLPFIFSPIELVDVDPLFRFANLPQ